MRRAVFTTLAPLLVCALVPPAPAGAAGPRPPSPERLADGRPNWNGVWVPVGGLIENGEENFDPAATAVHPSPMKSPYKERWETLLAAQKAGEVLYDPAALCLPAGMPRMMNMVYTMEITMAPDRINIFSEWQNQTRRIHLDGRGHPPEDELEPTYNGHSVGRWEGDVLAVDTVGVRADAPINQAGLPHSGAMRLSERYRMIDPVTLEAEIVVVDEAAFTAPWTIRRLYRHRPDIAVREYVCEENNRHVGQGGVPDFTDLPGNR